MVQFRSSYFSSGILALDVPTVKSFSLILPIELSERLPARIISIKFDQPQILVNLYSLVCTENGSGMFFGNPVFDRRFKPFRCATALIRSVRNRTTATDGDRYSNCCNQAFALTIRSMSEMHDFLSTISRVEFSVMRST
jgi:hypothetical protein